MKHTPPPNATEALIDKHPLVWERGYSQTEVKERLQRIREYNKYQIELGQERHCMTVDNLALIMAKGGYDWSLARTYGYTLPPSTFKPTDKPETKE